MFRGIDDVMNELHELFAKNEVFILQEVQEFTSEKLPVKKICKDGSTTESTQFHTHVTVKFRYVTTDGSSVETTNVGEAMDSFDKGMNKAMSIALKYSLLQMFLIPTKEKKDPDFDTPEETPYLDMALQEINAAQSINTLSGIYNSYTQLQPVSRFRNALSAKAKQLQDGIS